MAFPIPHRAELAAWWRRADSPAPEAVAAWIQAGLLATLPWLQPWRPAWLPLVAAAACVPAPPWRRLSGVDPWPAALVVASALASVAVNGGLLAVLGWLVLLALAVGVDWLQQRGSAVPKPQLGLLAGLLGWGGAIAVRPELLSQEWGGWLAPLVAVVVAQRLVGKDTVSVERQRQQGTPLGPPERELEGRLVLDRVVVTDPSGLPRTAPLELSVAAGESVAVLCGSGEEREAIVATVAGRRPPASGRVIVDGVELRVNSRVVAVVASGEPFVPGSLEANLGCLAGRPLNAGELRAAVESCDLIEVRERLGEIPLTEEGAPLQTTERLRVCLGRVLVSHWRLLVVSDPRPWVDDAAGERWRRAVVRASVGRTAIWLTSDRQLAERADRVHRLVNGRLSRE